MIAAVLCIIISYIEANEYVKVLVATNKNVEYTDEAIANIIADRVKLLNTISFIAIGLGLVGTILFRYLSEKKKKQYLSNEVQLMDCTENKENLYD
jgi:phosphatidylglycerophosphatase A